MPKIMLVEDDTTMLALLSTLLGLEGYQVIPVKRGQKLEDVFSDLLHEKPSLVLVDVHLHDFNGMDLLDAIRQVSELNNTRVVMSSGMDYTEECRKKGADNFLLKPYMPEDLIKMIRQTLQEPDHQY
jgi:DNA-binding response OmpR family regulator